MTSIQMLKNDLATIDKREIVDRATVNSRNRNDALTQERRFKADKTIGQNRLKNDEMTADRREMKSMSEFME